MGDRTSADTVNPMTPEPAAVGLRDALAVFAVDMEQQLRANDHKTGWSDCSQRWLVNRLKQETAELERALENGTNVVKEAADVANFAMMIADNARGVRDDA